jgi:P pilus assembly chaperone PapD
MNIAKKTILVVAILFPTLSLANIQISPMKILLKDTQSGVITVSSKGSETQYIQGSLVEVHNPGTAQESETPARLGSENSLVITPLKFALPAGNSQTVRVVSLGSSGEEQFYRAYFQSMTPEQMNSAEPDKNYQTSLSVNLVWGVIVMVPPANPVISVSYNP